MTTLKFLRKLADELKLPLEQLDDSAVEYVLQNNSKAPDIGADLYREYQEERQNP